MTTHWDADKVTVEIADDGPGFPPKLLARLGEPYLSARQPARPIMPSLGHSIWVSASSSRKPCWSAAAPN